jgi:hypothetical protein
VNTRVQGGWDPETSAAVRLVCSHWQRPYHIRVSMFCRHVHRSPPTGIRFLLVSASSLQPPYLSGITAPCRRKHRCVHAACFPRGQTRQWARALRQQDDETPGQPFTRLGDRRDERALKKGSSVVFVYIGCTEHRLPVHCNATPLEVPGLGPWEMCHATSNDHTLTNTFSVSGNVHAPPIKRQTPRPQHASGRERAGLPCNQHHTPRMYSTTICTYL